MSVWTSSFVFWSKLLLPEFGKFGNLLYLCAPKPKRRGARVVEEARLESVYTPKGYHEFESRSLREVRLL